MLAEVVLKDGQEPVTEQTPLLASASFRTEVPTPHTDHGVTFVKGLNARDGFALLIAVIIGSGIFASPSAIDVNVPSPGVALLTWAIGGLLAWTGAATLAELGAAFPGEGGIQEYLKYIYGDWVGFLAGWSWITAVMPATLAILGIVFVETVYEAAFPGSEGATGSWQQKGFSILIVAITLLVSSLGTKTSTTLNNIAAFIKLLAIFLVVLAGVVVAIIHSATHGRHDPGGKDWHEKSWFKSRPSVNPDGSITDWHKLSYWETFGHICNAVIAALWGYAGWDKANYVASELQRPAKQLPLAINTAVPIVGACYVLTNAAYYILVPWNMVGTTDAIAVTAIQRILGKPAALAMATLIIAVIAGALSGDIFIIGRLTVSAAHRKYLPSAFGNIGFIYAPSHSNQPTPTAVTATRIGEITNQENQQQQLEQVQPRFDAPLNAYILTFLMTCVYILFFSFRFLLTFDGVVEYAFFFLTVLGALILRFRQPELERPYKPFLLVPALFCVVSGVVVVRGAIFAPVQTLVLTGLMAIGLVGYAFDRFMERRRTTSE